MHKKTTKLITLLLIMLLLMTNSVFASNTNKALSDQEKEYMNDAIDGISDIYEDYDNIDSDIFRKEADQDQIISDIYALDQEIYNSELAIKSMEEAIKKQEDRLLKAREEYEAVESVLNAKQDEIGLQIRYEYMHAPKALSFITILLDSKSVYEFVTNLEYIKKIYKANLENLKSIQGEFQAVETKRQFVEMLNNSYERQISEMQDSIILCKVKKAKAEEERLAIKQNIRALKKMQDNLFKDANKLVEVIAYLQDPNSIYTGGKFLWPVSSRYITSKYGYRVHPIYGTSTLHTGVDVAVSSGTKVHAAAGGKVILAQWYGGYGYAVIIDHGSGISTLYGHNSDLTVSKGDIVTAGQVISKSGSTGASTGPHLHYEIRINGKYKNPFKYYNKSLFTFASDS